MDFNEIFFTEWGWAISFAISFRILGLGFKIMGLWFLCNTGLEVFILVEFLLFFSGLRDFEPKSFGFWVCG